MNTDTGKIRELSENEKPAFNEVEVDPAQMTKKQKKEMQVSLKDHQSLLGKKLTTERYIHLSKAERHSKTFEEIRQLRLQKKLMEK